ncbi:uncharacterized protein LOC117333997 [Pecten maximus]|uniref:uncharacterized protein LOC117333997 n=1 Tax=Pecten maximus TaxID=6579 RepID=UPI001458CC69|nr:uncharacterized protein LOC117333997 [Pecten maximus]
MTDYQAVNGLGEDRRKVGCSQPEGVIMDHSQTVFSSSSGSDTHPILTIILKEVQDIKHSLRKIDHLQTTILNVQQSLGSLHERVEQVSNVLSPSFEEVNHVQQGRQLEQVDNDIKRDHLDQEVSHAVGSTHTEETPSPAQYSRSNSKADSSFSEVTPSGNKLERKIEDRDPHSGIVVTGSSQTYQEQSLSYLGTHTPQDSSLGGKSSLTQSSLRQETTTKAESSAEPVSPNRDPRQWNSNASTGSLVDRSYSRTEGEYQSPSPGSLGHTTGQKTEDEESVIQQKAHFNTSLESQPNINFNAFKIKITPRKEDNRFVYHKISPPDMEEVPPPVMEIRKEEPQPVEDIDPVASLQSQQDQEEEMVQEPEQPRSMTDRIQTTQGAESVQVESESSSLEMESGLTGGETVATGTPVKAADTEVATATVSPIIAKPSKTADKEAADDSSGGPLPKERQFLESLTLKEAQRAAECRDPKSDGADTIICIDTSESMRGVPIQQAKDFINNFLEGIEECAVNHALEENIAIVTFGKTTGVAQHLTNDYSKIRDILEDLEIEGASPIMTGLVLCMSAIYIRGGVVSFRNRKIMPRILLVSDGHVTDARIMDGPDVAHPHGMSEEEAKQQLVEFSDRLKNEHRKVTCIPVGVADMSVLENLASTTGGEVASVEEAGRLSKQFLLDTIVARVMTDEASSKSDFGRQVMEKIVRDSTTGKDLTADEINVVFDKVMAELKDNPGGRDGAGVEEGPLPVGTRVRRGRDWIWDDQDDNMAGTIIGHKQRGFVTVEWDSGRKGKYRMGAEESYDLRSVEEPRFLPEGMLGAVGVCCRRGPDWEWDNQDGGEDQVGIVFKIEDNGVIHVRWQNGKRGNYRYGIHGKFDIEMCPGRQPVQNGGASSGTQASTPVKGEKCC